MIKLLVDCYGGDHSPEANVDGALMALKAMPDLCLILTGPQEGIENALVGKKYDEKRLEIVNAPEIIGVNEKPTDAIRLKKNSSLMAAVMRLRTDESVAGMVSTGSTGALVAGSLLYLGRLKNVIRPAFCPIMPTMNGGIVGICDSGANVDVTPDYLVSYAVMASAYMRSVYKIENPRVALLNIGVEEEKGDDLRKEAYQLLSKLPGINFVGNMESRDLLSGKYDVIVCDGFAGNVLIKTCEGTALELLTKVKRDIYSRGIYKFGALFMKKMFMDEKEFMNYQNYGGSVLLGLKKLVVKGHGSSKAIAVYKCIEQAYNATKFNLNEQIEALLPEYDKRA